MASHPFHLVVESPWPLTASLGAGVMMFTMSLWMHFPNFTPTILLILMVVITMIVWWRDVSREASFLGDHTYKVRRGLEWGMILFILSEVMFFSAFFWTFFHSSLAPTFDLGCTWPPLGVNALNPFSIPLLNTAVLLTSGATVTYAHHSMTKNNFKGVTEGLLVTVMLGAYFTYLQATEYLDTEFSFSDSAFGSTFFIATGFHGIHVMVGSIFLFVCFMRSLTNQMSNAFHFGFEAAAWYWHFVDIVWLYLFLVMYWWATP